MKELIVSKLKKIACWNVLSELTSKYNIEYFVVLAFLPNEETDYTS